MKYFKELSDEDREKVLDTIQDLPLFNEFRKSASDMLMTSRVHMFEHVSNGKIQMHVLPGDDT